MKKFDLSLCQPFHRIVTLQSMSGKIQAMVTDNVHQFAVSMDHQDGIVTAIMPKALRVPWTTCPDALQRLNELVGVALSSPLPSDIDKSWQCTHLFDLARLAMMYASTAGNWRYDVHVTTGIEPGTIEAKVLLQNKEIQRWIIAKGQVVSDGVFQGHVVRGAAQLPSGISPEIRVAALQMRRAFLVYRGSALTRDTQFARDLPYMAGTCHTFQPETVQNAERPSEFRYYPEEELPILAGI